MKKCSIKYVVKNEPSRFYMGRDNKYYSIALVGLK